MVKFVGLISGGKDSVFNIMKCVEAGHELVCLANMYPVDSDELNSYMYQSVGHEIIDLIGQAWDKPLYRRAIKGTPKVLDLEYGDKIDAEDEVEDLYELLKEVKVNILYLLKDINFLGKASRLYRCKFRCYQLYLSKE